jgi:hypothetical protein
MVHNIGEVVNEHVRSSDWLDYVLPVLAQMTRNELRDLGLSGKTIGAVRGRRYNPTVRTQRRLTQAAAAWAETRLGLSAPANSVDVCAAWLSAAG